MNTNSSLKTISEVEQWIAHLPERAALMGKLSAIRREINKIDYALSERPSIAAFGESQMGKSYLINAMLSTASEPFCITSGENDYDFLNDINPSADNAQNEATALITRFTPYAQDTIPEGYIQTELLRMEDLLIILMEAYYTQVDLKRESYLNSSQINQILEDIPLTKNSKENNLPFHSDVFASIEDYLKQNLVGKQCQYLLDSNWFAFLSMNLQKVRREVLIKEVLPLLWNKNKIITQLWEDLFLHYEKLGFASKIYVAFEAILKRYGTILDVNLLDLLYGEMKASPQELTKECNVLVSIDSQPISFPKSFLSALIAEVRFIIPETAKQQSPFLEHLDILDFPGMRSDKQFEEKALQVPQNIAMLYRRGKVAYLFTKYATAKRISALLFCKNHDDPKEDSMDNRLKVFINRNIGDTPQARENYMRSLNKDIAPLFIVCTYFNKNLEYTDSSNVQNLDERWQRRFVSVLEREVLKTQSGDTEHWFHAWTNQQMEFNNLYLLRDFKYSKTIFTGYDRICHHPETDWIIPQAYPQFYEELKDSFVHNAFVKTHFREPAKVWDSAAVPQMDGTSYIIANINQIAPELLQARLNKFQSDYRQVLSALTNMLQPYYYSQNTEELYKQMASRLRQTKIEISALPNKQSSLANLLDTMMLPEAECFQVCYKNRSHGYKAAEALQGAEANIATEVGISPSMSKEEKLQALLSYYFCSDENELREAMEAQSLNLDAILQMDNAQRSEANSLLEAVEQLWFGKVLGNQRLEAMHSKLPSLSGLISILSTLYYSYGKAQILSQTEQILQKYDCNEATTTALIADSLSAQFNAFIATFGGNVIPNDKREEVHKYLQAKYPTAVSAKVDKEDNISNRLSRFLSEDNRELHQSNRQLMDTLSIAFFATCGSINYDIKANAKLGLLLEDIYKQIKA